jgi:hypothetical protein
MKRETSVLILGVLTGSAAAQEVSVNGSNTVRLERYDTRGFQGASPYPISLNTGFDEWLLNLAWQPSAYDRWRATLSGIVNDSPYRSPDRNVVPERVAFARENGEAAIPYRLEVGDFFAFTSFRTQQRALKGLAIELQPVASDADFRSSVLIFGGAAQPRWRNLNWKDDNSLGLSWLSDWRGQRVIVNVLRNERAPISTAVGTSATRSQSLVSMTAEAPFELGRLRWVAEAEAATLRGDTDVASDQRDRGLFAQLTGNDPASGIGWRLRGERYGAGYQPFGTAITPDRRAIEAHLSGPLAGALAWRGRYQNFRENANSTNPQDSRVAGLNLTGPVVFMGATINIDAFTRAQKSRDGTIDLTTRTLNALWVKPVETWQLQGSLLVQSVDDAVQAFNQPRTHQVGLTALSPVLWGQWSGSIGPGLTWRKISGGAANTQDLAANLSLNLSGGPHRMVLSAGRLAQNPTTASVSDVATVNVGFDYRYRAGPHEMGFDVALFDRKPKPGGKTEAYKLGLSWTVQFDRPARSSARPVAHLASSSDTPLARDATLLADVAPGADFRQTIARLNAAGITGGMAQGSVTVYELRLLADTDQRQRLVVGESGGRIARAGLIIGLDGTSGEDAGRTYGRVLRQLIERLGRPATTFEQGVFGSDVAMDVTSGRLVRVAEWVTAAGTVRLGIPKRVDGVARIEILHASAFGSPRDGQWGFDEVR